MKKLLKPLLLALPLSLGMTLTASAMVDFDQEEMIGRRQVSQGINQFAFAMYRDLDAKENITFSPLSLSIGLSMVYVGANGDTQSAIKEVFHYGENDAVFHENYGKFIAMLAADRSHRGTTFNIANDLWLQEDFKVLPNFSSALASAYGASPRLLNFISEPNAAMNVINARISDQTKGEIPSLLKKPLSTETRFVLTNALYFNAKWASAFRNYSTYNGNFHGMSEQVNYMHQTHRFAYGEDDTKQYVVMPYEDGEFATLFVLPKEGQMDAVAQSMGQDDFTRMMSSLDYLKVNLQLPKFSVRSAPQIKDILISRGLGVLFDKENADLSSINGIKYGDGKLSVANIAHEAVVKMYEGGTTAAAATAVIGVGTTSIRPPELTVDFIAERPFYFYIIHQPSNTIMFMGHVVTPKE